jgi:hypothetical protein
MPLPHEFSQLCYRGAFVPGVSGTASTFRWQGRRLERARESSPNVALTPHSILKLPRAAHWMMPNCGEQVGGLLRPARLSSSMLKDW